MLRTGHTIKILDHGYVKFIDSMGTDETIVEAARMSTGKGFLGWTWETDTYADLICSNCNTQHLKEVLPLDDTTSLKLCTECWEPQPHELMPKEKEAKLMGRAGQPRDLSLLETLMMNRHSTPFEMCEMAIEVKAPIMVFREWHRHRTQSYSEFSARYAQMPNEHYLPALDRIQKQSALNKQGSGAAIDPKEAEVYLGRLITEQAMIYQDYEEMVREGVAKEVARINTPVSRYSKMRAKTDVRNWLAFLSLRMEKSAQHEIQQPALVVASFIHQIWPRTYELFLEHEFLSVRFSRTEMRVLRALMANQSIDSITGISEKRMKILLAKLSEDKEKTYAHIPGVG